MLISRPYYSVNPLISEHNKVPLGSPLYLYLEKTANVNGKVNENFLSAETKQVGLTVKPFESILLYAVEFITLLETKAKQNRKRVRPLFVIVL